jgi:hypothetical protein
MIASLVRLTRDATTGAPLAHQRATGGSGAEQPAERLGVHGQPSSSAPTAHQLTEEPERPARGGFPAGVARAAK